MVLGPVATLIVLLTLATVLLVSGVAKARDPRATRDAFDALRVPTVVPADLSARLLPWTEIALAAALLVLPAPWLVVATLGVLVLMVLYTVLVGRALTFDDPVSCSCFGSIGSHDVELPTLGRNLLLTALAATATWSAIDDGSAVAAMTDLDQQGWWAVAAAVAAAAVAVLVVGHREPAAAPLPTTEVDYERRPIPYAAVTFPDDSSATLAELASRQARLVVVLNYHCGPCVRVARRLDEWAEHLGPAVGVLAVYPGREKLASVGEHSTDLASWEPEQNVRRMLGVTAPAAVLLGADGLMAGGPVTGEDAVQELVEDVLQELAAAHEDAVG